MEWNRQYRGELEESKSSRTCPVNVAAHLRCRDPRTTNTVMSSTENGNAKASTDEKEKVASCGAVYTGLHELRAMTNGNGLVRGGKNVVEKS
eukprot:scaffold15140_cov164-Cylindrotheca_fusiformis.AAC.1